MLWTLLTLTSSVSFLAGSVSAARLASAGFFGYLLAVVIGLLLAAANAWAMYKVLDNLVRLSPRWSESEWFGVAIFSAIVLFWLPLATFLGYWVGAAAIRTALH
jgi:hypothetical protein